jgi:hypothetical protein
MIMAGRLALLACALLVTACGETEDFSYYFDAQPYGIPACDQPDARLAGRRLVRLFTHRSVDISDGSRPLARYYRRYGFTFHTDRPAVVTEMPYALDTDLNALNDLLGQEFPGVNLDDEAALMRDPELYGRILKRVGNFMMRPMVEFAREHGTQGGAVTNLVVLRDLVRPGGAPLGPPGSSPAGVAVSPDLIAALVAEGAGGAGAWPDVDFPPGFTPMLFLHGILIGQLSAIDPEVRDLIAAHEFGHTAGLVHREKEGNLMVPFAIVGRNRCTDSLEPDQVTTFRAGVGLDRPAVVSSARLVGDPRRAVPPARLAAALAGDAEALGAMLAPLLHLHAVPDTAQSAQVAPL